MGPARRPDRQGAQAGRISPRSRPARALHFEVLTGAPWHPRTWRRGRERAPCSRVAPSPRPLPEGDAIAGTVATIFDALAFVLDDTRLESDLGDLLWSTVNVFHRAAQRIERHLDGNEQEQRRSQRSFSHAKGDCDPTSGLVATRRIE